MKQNSSVDRMLFQHLKTVAKNSCRQCFDFIQKMSAHKLGALVYHDRILDH